MIWRLAFEKKPIQFLREIIIQALVIFKLYSCSHSSFATHKLYPELGKACETSLYICWRHRFNVLCWTIVCNANICFNCQRNANYISLLREVIYNSDQNSGQNPSRISTDIRWKCKVELYCRNFFQNS